MPTPRLNAFDRNALVLTLCVWVGHMLINGVLYTLFPGYPNSTEVHQARALCAGLAISGCLALHAILRTRRSASPWFMAGALASTVPVAVGLTMAGARIFQAIAPLPPGYGWQWLAPGSMAVDYVGYQWMFVAWSALYAGLAYADEVRMRDQRLAETERAAQRAHLMALHLQINPHFLFNTLNTLAGLVALGRNRESETMVLNLSRFLRYTLASSPNRFATVAEETDMLRRYLDVEQARFSDRLSVRYAIGPECVMAAVPTLLLLPLAENAIKHGLGVSEQGIAMEIGARREGDELHLWMANSLPHEGVPTMREGMGIGLANVRERLRTLYGEAASLEAGPFDGGWRASVRMPWNAVGA